MSDKVKVLFPNMASAADEPTPADQMADHLVHIAEQIRRGERNPRYGLFLYEDHDSSVVQIAVGDSTKYQHVALTAIGHAAALKQVV